jgi:alkylhydroperoxidase/carboxymuconolactone decarboxylase family protein YurZ
MGSDKKTKDVTDLLSRRAIRALRKGYDGATMATLATAVMVKDFAESEAYVNAVHDTMYASPDGSEPLLSELSGRERETALIPLITSQRAELELAVHVYWGIMEGLSPDEVAGLMLVSGIYSGIGNHNAGIKVMRKVLVPLQQRYLESREMSDEDAAAYLKVWPVLSAMLAAFN